MSAKQWLVLLFLFIAYLLVGAAVFYCIEHTLEIENHTEVIKEQIHIYGLLDEHCRPNGEAVPKPLLDGLSHYCRRTVYNYTIGDAGPKTNWHFYNAVFFVLTVVSTIGYGNLAPTCSLSRNLMIVYALVGIPINGILLKHMADFFGNFFHRAHERYKRHRHEGRAGLISDILLYLIPGLVVFIIFPATIFHIFEKWTFEEGIYFAFVTLTTIGFGDLVAGQTDDDHSAWYVAYKIFLILWVIFGLGYLVMLLGFITRALRSKRMARLEHKLANQIKQTHTKLWQGLVQETRFLRRALNELYLLKLKPVYRDSGPERYPHLCRSASAPEIYHLPSNAPVAGTFGRPRALSEVLHIRGLSLQPAPLRRPRSESELSLIDRRATFADTSGFGELDPAEILHEFMSALVPDEPILGWRPAAPPAYAAKAGTPMPDGGIMGFSDLDIMADERPKQTRGRAASLAPRLTDTEEEEQEQWTWSGAAASKRIQDLLRARNLRRQSVTAARQLQELQEFQQLQQLRAQHKELQKQKKRRRCQSSSAAEDTGSTLSLTNNNGYVATPGPKTPKSPPIFAQGLPARGTRRSSLFTPTQRIPRQFGSRQSVDNTFDPWDHWSPGLSASKPASRKISTVNMGRSPGENASSVLETTSLADFLRVLQSVRAQAAAAAANASAPASASASAPSQQRAKSRKLGTAYLQPLYPEVYENAKQVSRPRSASSSGVDPPRRKFSIWPSVFSSSQTVLPQKQDKHRRLSSLFTDPPKKRRFSIWPTFGGKASADVEAPTPTPPPTDTTPPVSSPPPKITVSYVSDKQPGPGPEFNPSVPCGVSWGTTTSNPSTGNGSSPPPSSTPGAVTGSSPGIANTGPGSLTPASGGAGSGSLRRQALTQQHRLSNIPAPAMDNSMRRPSPPAGFLGSLDSSALFRRRSKSDLPSKPSRRQ